MFTLGVRVVFLPIYGQAKGDAAPSFMSQVLQEGVTPEEENILKWAAFSMYLGMRLAHGSRNR